MALPRGRLIRFARRAEDSAPSASEIIAALPVPTLLIDPQGVVAEVNAAAESMLNAGRGAIIGKPLDAQIGFPAHLSALAGERGAAPLTAFDILLTNPRGLRLVADIALSPIAEREGWRILAIHPAAASHPIAGNPGGARAASGAAAMLAHEIKNPLSGIRGAAQLLAREGGEEAAELTGLIANEVDRIAGLIDRMESFSDARPLALEPANIYPVLDHALGLARHGFASTLDVRADYDPSLPPALVNCDALTQIVLNLLKNAAEALAGREDGRIRVVTAYRHGVSVPSGSGAGRVRLPIEVSVVDNGAGPPPDIAEQLFQPFVSSKASGGGLGLALVDKLVRDMGGIVQFAREGTPERTVFRLLLRRAP